MKFRSQVWGLPYSGGWMEQPAGLVDKMDELYQVFLAHREMRKAKSWVDFSIRHPEMYQVITRVMKVRKLLEAE